MTHFDRYMQRALNESIYKDKAKELSSEYYDEPSVIIDKEIISKLTGMLGFRDKVNPDDYMFNVFVDNAVETIEKLKDNYNNLTKFRNTFYDSVSKDSKGIKSIIKEYGDEVTEDDILDCASAFGKWFFSKWVKSKNFGEPKKWGK
jgi:hypothetical protein